MNDLISRQDAIEAISNLTNCGDEKTLRAYVAKHNLDNGWTGGVLEAIDAIEDLPSVEAILISWIEKRIINAEDAGQDVLARMWQELINEYRREYESKTSD